MRGMEHLARFVAEGRTVWMAYFKDGVLKSSVPDAPKMKGFVGSWAETDLSDSDVTVKAVYRPVRVTYVQYDGSSVTLDLNDAPPEPLPYEGCEASWEPFEAGTHDLEVRARYKGPAFVVRFMADGEQVALQECRAGEFPVLPPIPEKRGYRGVWPAVVPCAGRIRVHAEYVPLRMRFVTGIGKSVCIDYGPDWRERAPQAPRRRGFTGGWAVGPEEDGEILLKPVYVKGEVSKGPNKSGVLVFDRDMVEKALEDLDFVADAWCSTDEEAPVPEYTINDASDTGSATGWEGFAGSLGAVERGYLESCLEGRVESEDYLRKQGMLRLAVESVINAVAEDFIGDPIVFDGEIDEDYEADLREMLKDGS